MRPMKPNDDTLAGNLRFSTQKGTRVDYGQLQANFARWLTLSSEAQIAADVVEAAAKVAAEVVASSIRVAADVVAAAAQVAAAAAADNNYNAVNKSLADIEAATTGVSIEVAEFRLAEAAAAAAVARKTSEDAAARIVTAAAAVAAANVAAAAKVAADVVAVAKKVAAAKARLSGAQ